MIWERTRRAFAGSVGLLVACGGGPASDRPALGVYTDTAFADSTETHVTLDSARLDAVELAHAVLRLPDSTRDYEMAAPTSVSISSSANCLIAVSDGRESAIHYFSSGARYLGTMSLGGRGRAALSGVGPISLTSDGRAYLGEVGRRRIVVIDAARRHFRSFQSESVVVDMPVLSAVVEASRTRLLENWMVEGIPVPSGDWARSRLPLIRLIDTVGNVLGGFWKVNGRPGLILTSALNRGFLAVRADTLWFAYAASGWINRGIISRRDSAWTISDGDRIELPRMYHPAPPQSFTNRSDTVGKVTLDNQVTAFAVAPGGTLVIGQTVSYPPRIGQQLHLATSALALYEPSGQFIRGWRVGGRIVSVAADGGIIAAIVAPATDQPFEVRVYDLTVAVPGATKPGACVKERQNGRQE